MSQASSRSRDIETGDGTVHDHHHRDHSRSTLNQSSQPPQSAHGAFNYGDSSWPLFSMYSEIAQKEDEKMAELWQTNADRTLILIGLFSALVATLFAGSLSDIRPSPEGTSAEILLNIYQVLTEPNVTRPPNIPILRPFSPPRSAVWVNTFWALSLVISLTDALLATMLQQWARQYIKDTQRQRLSPETRARTRAFYLKAVDALTISQMVEVLPALLHFSIMLFFSGLVVFFHEINSTLANLVNAWILLSMFVYLVISVLPIVLPGSPYFTPLSPLMWFYWAIIQYTFRIGSKHRVWLLANKNVWRGQEAISRLSPLLDVRILDQIIYGIREDDTLEKFFDVIPDFFDSDLVKDSRGHFPLTVSEKFQEALRGFLRRTLSSNTVPESVKTRRLDICMNAMNAIRGSETGSEIFNDILYGRLGPVLQSIETGHALARWCHSNQQEIAVPTRCIVARILANVRERDERWVALASDQFDLPEDLVRDNITRGNNSILLSTLIHIARQAIRSGSLKPGILSSLSQFYIHDTAPGLQQDFFCTLWNEVVQAPRIISADILDEIRDLYISLHQDTEVAPTRFPAPIGNDDSLLWWPWSYPLCTIASHRPGTTDRGPSPSPAVLPPQSGDSPDALPHSTILESQATPSSNITRIQAEEATRTSAIHAAPRISLVTDHPIPEDIGTAEVHEGTRDQDPLTPLEDPRHPHRSALSPAETVASVVPPDNTSPPIRTDEVGEASQAPAATSLDITRIQAEEATTASSIHAAPRIRLVTDHPILEDIGTAEVHEGTRDQDPLAPLEDPHHPHRSALSPAETVASVVPSDNTSPPIRADEAGEASQAPAATSLDFPRTGPDVSAFSVPEPIHTSPRRMDGSSPSDLASDL